MNLKLNSILAIIFLVILSIALKQLFPVSTAILALIILFGNRVDEHTKNLLLIIICTLPFLPFFVFFLFYLPFIVFGSLLSNPSFIKSYVLGTSVILLLRIMLYYANMAGVPLTEWTILFVILAFLALSYFLFIKKNGISAAKSLFSMGPRDYKILLGTLFFLFVFASIIYNNTSLYGSNGTQIYTKQKFVIDSIENYGFFPHYDPGIGMGEQLFLTDSPTHFTKDVLVLTTIWMKQWFGEVLIYNAYSLFILWMVMLAASLLLRELLSKDGKDNTNWTPYFVILGSCAIGLSFQFVRILESFKAFSAHPINMLLFALLLTKPKKAAEWFIIGYLMLFSYMVHAIQAIGVFVFGVSILIVLHWRDSESFLSLLNYGKKRWFLGIVIALVFIGVLLGYTLGGFFSKNYLRETLPGIFLPDPITNIKYFVKDYFTNDGTTPFSINYPDLRRLDTKQSGFFLTVIGGISFFLCLFGIKNTSHRKTGLFNLAFIVQFFLYGFATNTFNVGNLEPGYRIILPYTVVVLALSISSFCDAIPRNLKFGATFLFLAFFLHSSYYASINMANIHSSSVISKNTLSQEIAFIETLPLDGRFITYGLFSNEMDAGIAAVTGKYFTRYQYNLWTSTHNIYGKVHTQHSFGEFPELEGLTGTELKNYWILGGYKYLFLNVCHPVGNTILQKTYPNHIQPLYQNQQNQCLIIAKVNDSEYVTTATIQKNLNESAYAQPFGYRYYSLSSLPRYEIDVESALSGVENDANLIPEPRALQFKRENPQYVIIEGGFKEGDWVNFKEEYFFRWKAFINGEEQQIYPSNFNMILIKVTQPGNTIELIYQILPIEKFFNTVSLIATIACAALFLLLLRNPDLFE